MSMRASLCIVLSASRNFLRVWFFIYATRMFIDRRSKHTVTNTHSSCARDGTISEDRGVCGTSPRSEASLPGLFVSVVLFTAVIHTSTRNECKTSAGRRGVCGAGAIAPSTESRDFSVVEKLQEKRKRERGRSLWTCLSSPCNTRAFPAFSPRPLRLFHELFEKFDSRRRIRVVPFSDAPKSLLPLALTRGPSLSTFEATVTRSVFLHCSTDQHC